MIGYAREKHIDKKKPYGKTLIITDRQTDRQCEWACNTVVRPATEHTTERRPPPRARRNYRKNERGPRASPLRTNMDLRTRVVSLRRRGTVNRRRPPNVTPSKADRGRRRRRRHVMYSSAAAVAAQYNTSVSAVGFINFYIASTRARTHTYRITPSPSRTRTPHRPYATAAAVLRGTKHVRRWVNNNRRRRTRKLGKRTSAADVYHWRAASILA